MRHLVELVAGGDDRHRAVRRVARGQRHPGGRDIRRGEAPISRILVPRDKGRIGRFLDKEIAAPAQDVGAEHILDGVEDPRMTHEIGEKRKEEMRLVAQVAAERPAHLRLDRFELLAQGERLILRHDRDRREIALFVVLRDLGFGQRLRHGSAPPGNEPVYIMRGLCERPAGSINPDCSACAFVPQSIRIVKNKIVISDTTRYCLAVLGREEDSSMRPIARRSSAGRTGFSR